jgi:hypothetical protein
VSTQPRSARTIFEEYLELKRVAFRDWEALALQGWPDYAPAIRNRFEMQMRVVDREAYRMAKIWERAGERLEMLNSLGAIDEAIKAQWLVADESDAVRRDPIYAAIAEDTARLQKLGEHQDVDPPFEDLGKRPEWTKGRAVLAARLDELNAELAKRLEG